jgi:diaminopimelate epimerase
MKLHFTKMHGCGNDYVYVNCMDKMLPNPGKISEYVSPRHLSVGSDGLICICPSDKADFRMRMFNADASEGKMCGNGSRCVAKYVYDKGLTDKTTITLETLSGIKTIAMNVEEGKVTEAMVDMGEPITDTPSIPMRWDKPQCLNEEIEIEFEGKKLKIRGTAVSMGNPHFVTVVDDVDKAPVTTLGPVIEHSSWFPERVNVEFVQIIDRNHVKFRVWERGSGETYACGTGACAVAYTMVTLGLAGKKDEFLDVGVLGGTLQLKYGSDGHMMMRGPATTVYEGEMEIPDELLK